MGNTKAIIPAQWDAVIELLEQGHTLTDIAAMDGMPGRSTMTQAMRNNPDLQQRIARARDIGWDARAERIMRRVDTEPDPVKARLLLDAERWMLAKMNPDRYGEKIRNELTGAGGKPIEFSESERASRLASLLGLAEKRRASDTSDLA